MQTILQILEKAGGFRPSLYLVIENPPYMELVIEATDESGPLGFPAISIAHYGKQNGDAMRDPEMCFELSKPDGKLILDPYYTRFAYVSVSRASEDARIYTNNATTLAERLSADISKASAVEVASPNNETQTHRPQPKEQTMTNTKELTPEEQRRQFQQEAHDPAIDKAQSPSEIDQRHYAPLHNALPNDASGYEWKRETGDIQSYQHNQTGGWLHIDQQSQFYDRHAQPMAKEHALEHAGISRLVSAKFHKLTPSRKAPSAPTRD